MKYDFYMAAIKGDQSAVEEFLATSEFDVTEQAQLTYGLADQHITLTASVGCLAAAVAQTSDMFRKLTKDRVCIHEKVTVETWYLNVAMSFCGTLGARWLLTTLAQEGVTADDVEALLDAGVCLAEPMRVCGAALTVARTPIRPAQAGEVMLKLGDVALWLAAQCDQWPLVDYLLGHGAGLSTELQNNFVAINRRVLGIRLPFGEANPDTFVFTPKFSYGELAHQIWDWFAMCEESEGEGLDDLFCLLRGTRGAAVIKAFLELPSCLQFDRDPKKCVLQIQKLLGAIVLKSSRSEMLHRTFEQIQIPLMLADTVKHIMEFSGDVLPDVVFRLPKVRFAKRDTKGSAQIAKVQCLLRQVSCLRAPLIRVVA
jgi:hypothetical protein